MTRATLPEVLHAMDNRRIDAYVPLRGLDEVYDGRTLSRVLLRKIARRLHFERRRIKPIVYLNGLLLFDRPDLHGGGLALGGEFVRVLLELGIKRANRAFEFCAGPGYIGYNLLANGFCETLALADVNPVAVEAAKKTAEFNSLTDRVSVYHSDILQDIPAAERWDLVVGNPPHFLQAARNERDLRTIDPEWQIHRAFYLGVKAHMKPESAVIMVENANGSSPLNFDSMIREGGGTVEAVVGGTDILGRKNGLYYLMNRW